MCAMRSKIKRRYASFAKTALSDDVMAGESRVGIDATTHARIADQNGVPSFFVPGENFSAPSVL